MHMMMMRIEEARIVLDHKSQYLAQLQDEVSVAYINCMIPLIGCVPELTSVWLMISLRFRDSIRC